MKIGIAGAGGIGSNVAACLVRSGVRRLKIIDFDVVEKSNLNRQFYFHDQIGRPKVEALAENLARIAPDLAIESIVLRLNDENMLGTFNDCDALLEGFDDHRAKKRLVETLAPSGLPIVSASGVAGRKMDGIEIRRLANCTVVGDFQTDACQEPCHAPKVTAVAAMMAHLLLEKGGFYERSQHQENLA